jgi:thiol-disulfide isomerase/thioredoxin
MRTALLAAIASAIVLAAAAAGFILVQGMQHPAPGPAPEGGICLQDGKPVVRLFSTTWCPHCGWIKDTFDRVAKEYVDAGKIAAYHWELDTGDNTLTQAVETSVPQSEMDVYRQFNPGGSIPTFVFGCRYYRIGNGYESQQNLTLEDQEFRQIIDAMVAGKEPQLTTFLVKG